MGRARCADGIGAWCEGWREMGRLEACPTLREGPRMTTSLQTDPRRTARDSSRRPGRPPLEMPVLFQLADLSLKHPKVAPVSPPRAVLPPTVEQTAAIPPEPMVEPAVVQELPQVEVPRAATPTHEVTAVETPRLEVPPMEPRPEPVPSQTVPEAVPIASESASVDIEPKTETPQAVATTADVTTDAPVASQTSQTVEVSATSVTDVTPPQDPLAPTPRERAEQRAKNRQGAPTHNDWMRTQGRYIIIGFVFALIATIYLAQNGDEPSPASPAANSNSRGETQAKVASESEITAARSAKESVPVSLHNHPTLLDETSPAAGESLTGTRAELFAPQSGGIIQEPSQPTEAAESKSLFPWKDTGETRVAAKPQGNRTNPPAEPKLAGPSAEAQEESSVAEPASQDQEVPSIYGPPESARHESPSGEPASEGPSPNVPASYPVTDPKSYREAEQPPNRTTPVQPRGSAPRATPASYQPGIPNNAPPSRTSGPRYERTGSGLY
jgi:hypothetical protein